MTKPYDATLKALLDTFAADWVRWLAPRLGLPAADVTPVDADLSTVQPAADKVFRLSPAGGLLHLEVQASWDGDLPDRLLLYNVLLAHRHDGPVASVVLLLRRDANSPTLTGTLAHTGADGREYLRFNYAVIRLWELPADSLLAAGVGLAPLAPLTDDAAPRLAEVVARFVTLVEAAVPVVDEQSTLLTSCFILMGMRYDGADAQGLLMGVQKMRESSTYQLILDEGRAEGLAKGRAEAAVETAQDALLAMLEERFGPVPPDVEARVRAERDVAKLRYALRQTVHIAAAADLPL